MASKTLEPVDINKVLAVAESWPPEVRERMAGEIAAIARGERRHWYCRPDPKHSQCANPKHRHFGRRCDGRPHPGFDYNHARADQWPPSGNDWLVWFLSSGRGSGKTRSGAEYTRKMSSQVSRIALCSTTATDVRETLIEGESGLIMACERAGEPYDYQPSRKRFLFTRTGCVAQTFSGEEPKSFRGPQFGFGWFDEPAHYEGIEELWDNFLLGLRLGQRPHVLLTSTPIPSKWVKKVQADKDTRVVRVSTFSNIDNLAPIYRTLVVSRLEGTRKGLQELEGQVLETTEGALWEAEWIRYADSANPRPEEFDRIIVAIDPAGTANRKSDETGIVVVGKYGDQFWVLSEATGKYSPNGWAKKALHLYETWHASAIVAEKNYGGDMVRTTIENAVKDEGGMAPRILIRTAMKNKQLRAEPVVALYETMKVFHLAGLGKLEEEMLTWVPGKGDSPNAVDALVWAVTEMAGITKESKLVSSRDIKIKPRGVRELMKGLPF